MAYVQTWREEFLSAHIQAVSIKGDDLWLGSYRGLYRVRGGIFEKRLLPRSVFSIQVAQDGGVWAGYEGLQYIAKDDTVESLPDLGNLYDIQDQGEQLWFTSSKHGVAYLQDQTIIPHRKEIANALFFDDKGLWIAADEGLITPQNELKKEYSTVYAIENYNSNHWLATQKGLIKYEDNTQVPLYEQLSSTVYQTVVPTDNGAILFTNTKAYTLGKADFHKDDWTKTKQGWYQEKEKDSWIDLSRYKKRLWRLNDQGIWGGKNQTLLYEESDLVDIEASSLSVWGQSKDGRVYRFTLGKREGFDIYDVQQISSGEKSLCVATAEGLYRIWQRKENSVEKVFPEKIFVESTYSEQNGTCWYATRAGQLGRVSSDQQNRMWELPPHVGLIKKIVPQQQKGVWLLTQKGVWLLRIQP